MGKKQQISTSAVSSPAKKRAKTTTLWVKKETTEATVFIHKVEAVTKNPVGVHVVDNNLYLNQCKLAGYLVLENTEQLWDLFETLEQDAVVKAFLNVCKHGFRVKGWTDASQWQLNTIWAIIQESKSFWVTADGLLFLNLFEGDLQAYNYWAYTINHIINIELNWFPAQDTNDIVLSGHSSENWYRSYTLLKAIHHFNSRETTSNKGKKQNPPATTPLFLTDEDYAVHGAGLRPTLSADNVESSTLTSRHLGVDSEDKWHYHVAKDEGISDNLEQREQGLIEFEVGLTEICKESKTATEAADAANPWPLLMAAQQVH